MKCSKPLEGPLSVYVLAVFPCPKSDHKKRHIQPRKWHTKATGDLDNIAKAVLDAGNGVLWEDDRQIAALQLAKIVGAQHEPPRVELLCEKLESDPALLSLEGITNEN
jgi:Holliday junction resolvase RusA-like endonuclease